MKVRHFKIAGRQRMYDHYRKAEIERNTLASDRRLYWFGRFGYPARESGVTLDMHGYPAWAAGYDRYLDDGVPVNLVVHTAYGFMRPHALTYQRASS